jgi:hypothetical protein
MTFRLHDLKKYLGADKPTWLRAAEKAGCPRRFYHMSGDYGRTYHPWTREEVKRMAEIVYAAQGRVVLKRMR